MNSEFEERMLKKIAALDKPKEATVPFKHKPLKVNTKVDVTGKPQSLEDLMKALGLPTKKKVEQTK